MNTMLIEWLIVVKYAHSLICFYLWESSPNGYFPSDSKVVSIPYNSTFGVVSPIILIDGDHKD